MYKEYLKKKLTSLNFDVKVIPNLVEIPSYQPIPHDKIRIGYAGSSSHVGDFSQKLLYSLKKLFNRYSDKLELVCFGYVPPELNQFAYVINGVTPDKYLDTLNYVNFDIGLIPLADTEFNKSKSNLKWLEYSICNTSCVASDVPCYSEIEDGVTGIKIRDDKWYDTLEHLINDSEYRNRIASQSYDYVMNHYTWRNAMYKQSRVYAQNERW